MERISAPRSTATPSSISPPNSTSTTAAAWTRRFWAWHKPTHKATSTSAGSGRGSPDRVGSSTSAKTRKKWLSWVPSWRRAERRSSTGDIAVSDDGVAAPKFLANVEQRTFSGQYAAAAGQPVLYVTERCVFRLTPDGLELIEIAPGIDLEKDVLAHVGFTPIIDGEPKLMDERLFRDEPMGLKDDLLSVPLDARLHLRRRSQHLLHQHGRRVGVHRSRRRGHRRRDLEKAGRGRQEGSRRGQLRQLLPGARPRRHVHLRGPQSCRTLTTTASPATPPAHSCASN